MIVDACAAYSCRPRHARNLRADRLAAQFCKYYRTAAAAWSRVAFKIYGIMAWRAGKTNLLQSTLTRAVIFSAMTTATAFGSLWLSEQPGIASMGKLMALSLA